MTDVLHCSDPDSDTGTRKWSTAILEKPASLTLIHITAACCSRCSVNICTTGDTTSHISSLLHDVPVLLRRAVPVQVVSEWCDGSCWFRSFYLSENYIFVFLQHVWWHCETQHSSCWTIQQDKVNSNGSIALCHCNLAQCNFRDEWTLNVYLCCWLNLVCTFAISSTVFHPTASPSLSLEALFLVSHIFNLVSRLTRML